MGLIIRLKAKCVENETRIMRESNLSPSELHGLEHLNPGEVVSGKNFSDRMRLSPSRASRVVEKMVQKGFIVRHDDPNDRRKSEIFLSAKGERIKKKIEMMRGECEKKVRKKMTDQEFEHFTLGMKKTIQNL